MSKKKNKKQDPEAEAKIFVVTGAAIKDDFCHYSFEVKRGVGIGDTHNVKGSGIVDEDMKIAFARLNVHLAAIDDAFKGEVIKNIDKYHNHEITQLYQVTGFKIKGSDENEQIILEGSKYVNIGDHIALSTPRILLDTGTPYKWYNELKVEADKCRTEVELYIGGKCTPVEIEEKEDPAQLNAFDEEDETNFDDAKM